MSSPRATRSILPRLLLAAAAAAAIGAGALAADRPADASARATAGDPNVIAVVVDDQAENSFKRRFMPQTFNWLVDRGTRFANGLAAPPLCCPDRAGLLTGDYPHNSGVFWNDPGYSNLIGKDNTLPVWLGRAGYRTGMIGKLMNGYDEHEGLAPAPGFDYWFDLLGEQRYFDYQVSDQGTLRSFGHGRRHYSTNVFTRHAKQFVRQSAAGSSPFFLWLGYDAPHTAHADLVRGCGGNDPIPADHRSVRRFQHVPLPRPPSYNERDVSDKPANISELPPIDGKTFDNIRRRYHCTLAADLEVDHAIGRLRSELHRDGELSRTIVFYYSDNGYFFGEHRLSRGKTSPYEPALRVPYAVHVPPRYRTGPQRRVRRQLVTNEDITATVLDYAGGAPSCAGPGECRTLDGRSIRPLLGGPGGWPADRGVLAEISGASKHWRAIRTPRYMYARYRGGARELYDLRRDPDELRNVAGAAAYTGIEGELAARLGRLRHCAGIEGRDQPVDGQPFCQ